MITLMTIITIPQICQYIPDSDWVACSPPPVVDMCFSMTNYWPFDTEGKLTPLEGQADSDPTSTANGYKITSPDQAESFVAAPLPFVGQKFCNEWLGCVPIHDTFGNKIYQNGPFWHSGHGQHVVPIDVFSPEPIYYLECNGEIK